MGCIATNLHNADKTKENSNWPNSGGSLEIVNNIVGASQIIDSDSTTIHVPRYHRTFDGFLLMWLDSNISDDDEDFQNSVIQLEEKVSLVNIFVKDDVLLKFFSELVTEKAFLIVSGSMGKTIIPKIHDKRPLDSVYIFCSDISPHQEWSKGWPKIKGIYTDINIICACLRKDRERCLKNNISMTFSGIDTSFIYSQLLRDAFLKIRDDPIEKNLKDLSEFCHTRAKIMENEMRSIGKASQRIHRAKIDRMINDMRNIESNYQKKRPIYWYTIESFLYPMLNRALRELEVDTIYAMGFFIRHLHNDIAQLQQEQELKSEPFTVYRGQGLIIDDFEKMRNTIDGFICFNNFLSTSTDRIISLGFARNSLQYGYVRILFEMSVDPKLCNTTPFAFVGDESAISQEKEILFSTHTIFRIGHMKELLEEGVGFWQVQLTTAAADDPGIIRLFRTVRDEVAIQGGEEGRSRLGYSLIKIGKPEKAEELYQQLLKDASSDSDEAYYQYKLGDVYHGMTYYEKALDYYQKACDKYKSINGLNHINVARCYNSMGATCNKMKNYEKAIDCYRTLQEILEMTAQENSAELATCYNNMGLVYMSQKQYATAREVYEKALSIRESADPKNNAELASSYASVGVMHEELGNYPEAIKFIKKAIEIEEKILSPNHPDLGTSYHNLGVAYHKNNDNKEAIENFGKALKIKKISLPSGDPRIQITERWLGSIDKKSLK